MLSKKNYLTTINNKETTMWDTNMFKDFDPLNYNTVKKNINNFNQKVINFWKDFYNDLFNNIKRED
jgi:hypothetical protein